MARSDPQVNIRMPLELKERLEVAAQDSKRSLNAEIVQRLDDSFTAIWPRMADHEWMRSVLPTEMFSSLEAGAKEREITLFAELLLRLKFFENFVSTDAAFEKLTSRVFAAIDTESIADGIVDSLAAKLGLQPPEGDKQAIKREAAAALKRKLSKVKDPSDEK